MNSFGTRHETTMNTNQSAPVNILRRIRPSRNLVPPSDYAWTITSRTLNGVSGPSNAPDELLAQLNNGEGRTFRMYDDEGTVYIAGRIVGRHMDEQPLFDVGLANGCDEIRYDAEDARNLFTMAALCPRLAA